MPAARCLFRTLVLAGLSAAPLSAQAPTVIDSGRVVRVHLSSGDALQGYLLVMARPIDPLVLCRSPGAPCTESDSTNLRRVGPPDVMSVDVRTRTRAPEGVLVGALVGAFLASGAHSFAQSSCESSGCAGPAVSYIIPGMLLVALLGAMVGTGFAYWQPTG